jgi:hypothetical protein
MTADVDEVGPSGTLEFEQNQCYGQGKELAADAQGIQRIGICQMFEPRGFAVRKNTRGQSQDYGTRKGDSA